MRAAEEAFVALFECFAFVVADDEDLVAVELGETSSKRAVVTVELVAVELDEFIEEQVEIVGQHRPIGMTGDLDRFPRIEFAVDTANRFGELAAERADLIAQ